MSLDPMLWALKEAPVLDAYERVVLLVLAEAGDDDGCNCYPSKKTIARQAKCSVKKVQRILGDFLDREIIGYGDQRAAAHIRADRRPVVYDVLIPWAFWAGYPEREDRIQEYRRMKGRPPLNHVNRPRHTPAEDRPRRADFGVPRPKKTDEQAESDTEPRGDSQSPREETAGQATGGLAVPPVDNSHGGTSSPARGDYKSRTGGLAVPQTTPYPPQEPSRACAREDHEGGGEAEPQHHNPEPLDDEHAERFLRSLKADGRRWWVALPARRRHELLGLVRQAWDLDISNAELRDLLDSKLGRVNSLPAVWCSRLKTRIQEHAPTAGEDHTPTAGDLPVCGSCDGRPDEPLHVRRRPLDPEFPERGDTPCPDCNPAHPEFDLQRLLAMLTEPASA